MILLTLEASHERKALTGRYYQLLSRHAATAGHLRNKIHRSPPDRCWQCDRHHLFAHGEAWKLQINEMWKDIGAL